MFTNNANMDPKNKRSICRLKSGINEGVVHFWVSLEEEMATQSSILTGKVHGQRCLAGYSPWGCRESDTTVQLSGGVCNFLSSVSPQQKFETVDQCYSLVTAQFYLASKGNHILKA